MDTNTDQVIEQIRFEIPNTAARLKSALATRHGKRNTKKMCEEIAEMERLLGVLKNVILSV